MAVDLKRNMFVEFLRHPVSTGSIFPSSRWLCRALADNAGLGDARCVVELGPGTGVVTRQIVASLRPDAFFFAVELNEKLIERLRVENPSISFVHGSAEDLVSILADRGQSSADAIVSSLPWACFPDDLQDRILDAISASLKPGGRFLTYAYVQGVLIPGAHRFRKKLLARFGTTDFSSVIWRNLPPAFLYRCTK